MHKNELYLLKRKKISLKWQVIQNGVENSSCELQMGGKGENVTRKSPMDFEEF